MLIGKTQCSNGFDHTIRERFGLNACRLNRLSHGQRPLHNNVITGCRALNPNPRGLLIRNRHSLLCSIPSVFAADLIAAFVDWIQRVAAVTHHLSLFLHKVEDYCGNGQVLDDLCD